MVDFDSVHAILGSFLYPNLRQTSRHSTNLGHIAQNEIIFLQRNKSRTVTTARLCLCRPPSPHPSCRLELELLPPSSGWWRAAMNRRGKRGSSFFWCFHIRSFHSFVDMEWRFGENLHSIRISGRPIPSARLNEERSEADGRRQLSSSQGQVDFQVPRERQRERLPSSRLVSPKPLIMERAR